MKQTNCHNQGWLVGEGDPIQPTFIQNSALVDASSLWPCTKGGGGGGGLVFGCDIEKCPSQISLPTI